LTFAATLAHRGARCRGGRALHARGRTALSRGRGRSRRGVHERGRVSRCRAATAFGGFTRWGARFFIDSLFRRRTFRRGAFNDDVFLADRRDALDGHTHPPVLAIEHEEIADAAVIEAEPEIDQLA